MAIQQMMSISRDNPLLNELKQDVAQMTKRSQKRCSLERIICAKMTSTVSPGHRVRVPSDCQIFFCR